MHQEKEWRQDQGVDFEEEQEGGIQGVGIEIIMEMMLNEALDQEEEEAYEEEGLKEPAEDLEEQKSEGVDVVSEEKEDFEGLEEAEEDKITNHLLPKSRPLIA